MRTAEQQQRRRVSRSSGKKMRQRTSGRPTGARSRGRLSLIRPEMRAFDSSEVALLAGVGSATQRSQGPARTKANRLFR